MRNPVLSVLAHVLEVRAGDHGDNLLDELLSWEDSRPIHHVQAFLAQLVAFLDFLKLGVASMRQRRRDFLLALNFIAAVLALGGRGVRTFFLEFLPNPLVLDLLVLPGADGRPHGALVQADKFLDDEAVGERFEYGAGRRLTAELVGTAAGMSAG